MTDDPLGKNVTRYRPGEAIRWLQTGAASSRRSARDRTRGISAPSDLQSAKQAVSGAAGALFDYGKSAVAELLHKEAIESEYILYPDHFEIVKPGSTRKIPYDAVKSSEREGDKLTLAMQSGGSITIKPFAHIVAGRIKAPIGWNRNGMEVPFETLFDELEGRVRSESS